MQNQIPFANMLVNHNRSKRRNEPIEIRSNTDFKNRERGRLENMRTEGGLGRAPRFKRGKFVV